MSQNYKTIIGGLAFVAALGLFAAQAQAAAVGKAANAHEIAFPKSFFTIDNQAGLDPFYPGSTRWRPVVKVETEKPKPTDDRREILPPPRVDPWKAIGLKGVSGKNLALISAGGKYLNFGRGETLKIKTDLGEKVVRCVEITERSVTFSMEGETETKTFVVPQ